MAKRKKNKRITHKLARNVSKLPKAKQKTVFGAKVGRLGTNTASPKKKKSKMKVKKNLYKFAYPSKNLKNLLK